MALSLVHSLWFKDQLAKTKMEIGAKLNENEFFKPRESVEEKENRKCHLDACAPALVS